MHSAKCVLYSVAFEKIEILQRNAEWEKAAQILTDAACSLEAAGADFIIICTNTMHKVANEIQAGVSIPLLHIADITAEKVLCNWNKNNWTVGNKIHIRYNFSLIKMN